jgi:hypothetical protein
MATEKLSLADLVAKAVNSRFSSIAQAHECLKREGWQMKLTHLKNVANPDYRGPRTIPKSGLKALKVVFNVDISENWEEVEKEFDVSWARESLSDREPDADFQKCIDAIDKLHLAHDRASKEIGNLTHRLVRTLDKRHVLISITSGLYPAIMEWEDEMGPHRNGHEHRDFRLTALKNGLLWAYISPSLSYLKSLQDQGIRVDAAERYDQFIAGFKRLEQFFKENNVSDSVMHFEADNFPLTAYGWTTSLIGWLQDGHYQRLRVIVRNPYQRAQWYQMIPQTSDFEGNVLAYADEILKKGLNANESRAAWVRGFRRRIIP